MIRPEDNVVQFPTTYRPDTPSDELARVNDHLNWLSEEVTALSALVNKLIRGLAADRKEKKP